MTPFDIAAILVVLAALFGQVNYHFLKLPTTIGLVVIALAASLIVLFGDWLAGGQIAERVAAMIEQVDFYDALMNGMLGFLLFAGALHVDLDQLASQKWAIALMASLGVVISAAIVGLGFWWLAGVPFIIALVFGAIVSPTDPVAVLGLLKTVKVPRSLETKIAGESLFNDGVGVVLFLMLTAIAFTAAGHGADEPVDAWAVAELFLVEVGGGAVLGGAAGYGTYRLLRRVDEYTLELTMTLALVMGVYALAHVIHVSGPIAVVIAGLFIGNAGMRFGMSETTREHVHNFWHLIDELLNAVLFLLIGLEVFAIDAGWREVGIAVACIPLVLFARFCSVAIPIRALALGGSVFAKGSIRVMTWGGLRGGISVALVLSLPPGEWKGLLLTATYAVVIFSIVVQGLTIKRVITRVVPSQDYQAGAHYH
ncbi:MAG: sodium:proton antiporter [Alphaproteobacteria bacterium]